MTNKKTIICYLKDNTEVSTWNTLKNSYKCLNDNINFVPFNGNDKFNITVDVANGIANNDNVNNLIHFVALFNSTIEGLSNVALLKDIMNKSKKENIHIITLKTLWNGDFLPTLDQIDNHNLHFDNMGNEHEDFVTDYLENNQNFKRANYVFKNFINYLYEQKMLDSNLYDEFKTINDELINTCEWEEKTKTCEITQENEIVNEPIVEETNTIIEEPIVNDEHADVVSTMEIENEIELDEEVDLSNANKILVVPKKCREFYKQFENDYDGIIRIKKITNLNSVVTSFKQCLNKNKNTVFYFFPATSIKNQDIYEQKYLSLFNSIYKKFYKNPHVQFFKTNTNQPSLYLENILNVDRHTKNVLNTEYNNKNFVDLTNWLKQK